MTSTVQPAFSCDTNLGALPVADTTTAFSSTGISFLELCLDASTITTLPNNDEISESTGTSIGAEPLATSQKSNPLPLRTSRTNKQADVSLGGSLSPAMILSLLCPAVAPVPVETKSAAVFENEPTNLIRESAASSAAVEIAPNGGGARALPSRELANLSNSKMEDSNHSTDNSMTSDPQNIRSSPWLEKGTGTFEQILGAAAVSPAVPDFSFPKPGNPIVQMSPTESDSIPTEEPTAPLTHVEMPTDPSSEASVEGNCGRDAAVLLVSAAASSGTIETSKVSDGPSETAVVISKSDLGFVNATAGQPDHPEAPSHVSKDAAAPADPESTIAGKAPISESESTTAGTRKIKEPVAGVDDYARKSSGFMRSHREQDIAAPIRASDASRVESACVAVPASLLGQNVPQSIPNRANSGQSPAPAPIQSATTAPSPADVTRLSSSGDKPKDDNSDQPKQSTSNYNSNPTSLVSVTAAPAERVQEIGEGMASPQNAGAWPSDQSSPLARPDSPPASSNAIPTATIAGPVQIARMMNKAAQSEMRIGLNTSAFGNVEVRTVVHANDVGVVIGSERGDLRGLLTNELPGITNTLQQHDLRLNQFNVHQPGFAFSANSQSGGNSQAQEFVSKPYLSTWSGRDLPIAESSPITEPLWHPDGGLSVLA